MDNSFVASFSNEIIVEFLPNSIILEADPPFVTNGEMVTITAPIGNYAYEWFRIVDGNEELIDGESSNQIIVDEEGQYFVRLEFATCEIESEIITIGVPIEELSLIHI